MAKNNAMRVLDARNISYTPFEYDASIHSGVGVARVLDAPEAQVFKTLVAMPDRGRPLLAVIPGNLELNLKRLAAAAGEKRLRMATQREAESKTGLQVGGISALALLEKGFRVFLDASAQQWEVMYVSAGQRGLNLRLRVADYVMITKATVAPLTHAAGNSGAD